MTYREVWNWGKEILRHAGIPEADLDAWFLLEYVTGLSLIHISEPTRRS